MLFSIIRNEDFGDFLEPVDWCRENVNSDDFQISQDRFDESTQKYKMRYSFSNEEDFLKFSFIWC